MKNKKKGKKLAGSGEKPWARGELSLVTHSRELGKGGLRNIRDQERVNFDTKTIIKTNTIRN